ncbi:hypothetical protein DB88DRAFT_478472 [Papiliotrema laurentii]|uniref:Uncharacterized protein n=1 Tax=Papiliotrema laurentii TaxID=5418 RepID=A0AAD9L9K6_PAPLA|nr:hypothetical protein DB88DRAFT_478472 [Papiliotrema laurentii]
MSPTPLVNDTAAAPRAIQKGQQAVDPILGGEPKLNGTHAPANGKPASITGNNLFTLDYTGCIVTGGARGLGLCVAQSLLEAGSPYVYCVDILPEPSVKEWQEAEETAAQYGGQIAYRKLDITDQQAVQTVFGQIYDECPIPIAAFFAAAGIQQMIPSLDYPAADFRRIMDVNVTGTFLTIQAVAKEMVKRGVAGSIAITASMSGSIANKGLTCLAYNTSKAALLQMCRSAAAEWGVHGIRVNTLSPGYIRTAMTDQLLAERPDLEEEWLRGSMLHRLSTPDEFRGPVIYLLSKASSFQTGSDVIVDGGHTAY